MTEPGGGSDLANLRTTAVRDGDDWILNGSKTFITNGGSADLVLVAARTSPEKKAKGISLFAVDTTLDGFSVGRVLDKVGQDESDTAELAFDDVRVSDDDLVGPLDTGFISMMQFLPQERLGSADHQPRPRQADPRGDRPVRQGPPGVRPADRLLPEHPVPAGRPRHADRRHPGLRRPVRHRAHQGGAHPGRRRQGEVVDLAGPERRPRPLRPGARRLRLHERVPRRPRLARRPRHQDLGRLQRDHEDADRARPRAVVSGRLCGSEPSEHSLTFVATAPAVAGEDSARRESWRSEPTKTRSTSTTTWATTSAPGSTGCAPRCSAPTTASCRPPAS